MAVHNASRMFTNCDRSNRCDFLLVSKIKNDVKVVDYCALSNAQSTVTLILTDFTTISLLQLTLFFLFISLVSMQKYLNQFQYLSMSRSGNHDVKQALRSFQSFAGLNVTGLLDRATIKQMKKPRCGMPDSGGGGDRLRRYATYSKWRKTQLRYFIQHGRDLSQGQQDRIFAKALKYWADVSGLSFKRVSSPRSAELKIRLAILNSHFVFLIILCIT